MKAISDQNIIEQVLKGDRSSFTCLVERHKSMVFAVCFRILSNQEDAEEVAQDVFVKAFRNLGNFRGDATFKTWIYRIAFTTAISRKRKKQVYTADIDSVKLPVDHVELAQNGLSELNQNDRQKYLQIALEKLKEEERLLLTFYYFEEQSVEEIAELTGLSVSNVKVRLHRSRKKLYEELYRLLKRELTSIL